MSTYEELVVRVPARPFHPYLNVYDPSRVPAIANSEHKARYGMSVDASLFNREWLRNRNLLRQVRPVDKTWFTGELFNMSWTGRVEVRPILIGTDADEVNDLRSTDGPREQVMRRWVQELGDCIARNVRRDRAFDNKALLLLLRGQWHENRYNLWPVIIGVLV
jgi:hypothetical protein